jgi:hypothetical protein
MPDGLFRMWIAPEVQARGWPFRGDETEVTDPAWSRYLRGGGPRFWKAVRWSRLQAFAHECPIEARAILIAHWLADVGRKFEQTGVAEPTLVRNSPHKVAALAAAIRASGRMPAPLVCLERKAEWWLLDGQHRLAALFMLERQQEIALDCWLGTVPG